MLRSSGLKFSFSTYHTLIEILLGKSYFYHRDFIPKKRCVVFDVGAYVGHYALIAAHLGARVYAFEPISNNYAKLLHHISINKKLLSGIVFPIKMAVGSFKGKIDMLVSNGASHVIENSCRVEGRVGSRKMIEKVPITTIDIFTKENRIDHIDILKIDVEGYEIEVLRGAQKNLSSGKIDMILSANYHFPDEDYIVSEFLQSYGYKKILRTPGPAKVGGGVSYYRLVK